MRKLFAVISLLSLLNNLAAQTENPPIYTWDQASQANPDTIFKISFSKLKLDSLPRELQAFKKIIYLDVSKNKLEKLPDFIADFSNLKAIDISKNRFSVFPLVITRVKSIEEIHANRNLFDRLPESIGYCSELTYLDLWDTPVTIFPDSFFNLTKLSKVDLSGIRYSPGFQKKLTERLPNVDFVLDPPCDCMD